MGRSGAEAAGTRPELSRADAAAALLAFAAIVAHDAAHIRAGNWFHAFWVCNVAAALVGPSLLLRAPSFAGAALTWLLPGTVVWLTDAFVAGSVIMPTSYGVHIGGLLLAGYSVRRLGPAPRAWLAALGVLGFAVAASWLFLPPEPNVNAVHAVPQGWGFLGESRARFLLTSFAIVLVTCAVGQALVRWIGGPATTSGSTEC
jgi:hypothetical protein